MPSDVSILAFSGSARGASFNKQLVRIAVRGAEAAGAKVTLIDLADFELPVYNGDLEAAEGLPPAAARFCDLLRQHDGLLISSPENNGSISAQLKNTIDWSTRTEDDISVYREKIVTLMSASPGGLGGLRGLVHLRAILEMIGSIVLPDQITVRSAHTAFDADGEMTDERQSARVEALGAGLAKFLRSLDRD